MPLHRSTESICNEVVEVTRSLRCTLAPTPLPLILRTAAPHTMLAIVILSRLTILCVLSPYPRCS